jgi:hypothetical protein
MRQVMEDDEANTEQRLTQLCCGFADLDDSDKECVLRISQALFFATRKPDFASLSSPRLSGEGELSQWA